MIPDPNFAWTGTVGEVVLGATRPDGGTRSRSYRIGGGTTLPFMEKEQKSPSPLIAFEICDDSRYWSPIVNDFCGDLIHDPGAWAKTAETTYGADLVRLCLTITRQRDFSDIDSLGKITEKVLKSTTLPLIIEGSNEPKIDSEVFQKCGEVGQGERLLLGTAEAGRYRSIAAAALAYNHAIIAQSPIDINLAKQSQYPAERNRRVPGPHRYRSGTPVLLAMVLSIHSRPWNGYGSLHSKATSIWQCL